ncbi:hypothetical protein C8R42DRAFT_637557 [Lentinula raphanica]|nr:hypothetical protein C8R42DRAFT_637557 [Lentinula raphanica]
MLPNHFLAFLSTIGVALTAVAAPLPHATTHGESAQDDSGLEAPQALVNVYEHATSTDSLDPSTLPSALPNALSGALSGALPSAPPRTPLSTPNDGLWAENASLSPLRCDPSVESGCPPEPSARVARPVIVEARTEDPKGKGVMKSTDAASGSSPLVVVGSHQPNGYTILRELSERGQRLDPENVYQTLKSKDPARWEEDLNSRTLAIFKQTVSGALYMDTDRLLGVSQPEFDRVDLESMLLKDLFISVDLRPRQRIHYPTLTKNGHELLRELRTYAEDTLAGRNTHDYEERWQDFRRTHSGRLLQTLHEAIKSALPAYSVPQKSEYPIKDLELLVDLDLRGLTDDVDRASACMHAVLGDNWNVKKRACAASRNYIIPDWRLNKFHRLRDSVSPPVAEEMKKMLRFCRR